MQKPTEDSLRGLLEVTPIRRKLRQELRLGTSMLGVEEDAWADRELFAVYTKSRNEGVLWVETVNVQALLPFSLSRGLRDTATGRSKPVICDFCRSWQRGSNIARITLYPVPKLHDTFGLLVCADLECSLHCRTLTPAGKLSRTQLREDLDDAARARRLQARLDEFVSRFRQFQRPKLI